MSTDPRTEGPAPEVDVDRVLLDIEIRRLAQTTFSPYITLFAAICTLSAFAPIALWYSEPGSTQAIAVVVLTVLFGLTLLLTPMAIGHTGDVRGFTMKWARLLLLWAVLFVAAAVVPMLFPMGMFKHLALFAFAGLFLVLAIGAVILENDRMMKVRRELTERMATARLVPEHVDAH